MESVATNSFVPFGARAFSHSLPTADAVGFILTPLCGWEERMRIRSGWSRGLSKPDLRLCREVAKHNTRPKWAKF